MTWNDARPLSTDPGRALAVEVSDSPAHAHDIVAGALEGLAYVDCVATDQLPGEELPAVRVAYLRGWAAAAIVSDAVEGEREFTSAADFAVSGREVEFLPTGVKLGMLTLAASAMGQADWALGMLSMDLTPVPVGHREEADALRLKLTLAARARVKGARRG
ncbi:hypothetical protein AB0M39_40945 [Streptomyces sp. NPDC051907]|uniref:hypothetical protein n=1 Tax=Streptomyces sp. NPDC051907 TaxID=3155284 RepID=UPI00342B6EBA